MRLTLALLLLAMSPLKSSTTVADREMTPRPFIVSPAWPWAQYYFKMSPDPKSPYGRKNGYGYAYKIQLGEQDKLLWKTEGWFADFVFLSYNGKDLVRIGNTPVEPYPSADQLAVAFYHEGVLVKSYSTADLIKSSPKGWSSEDYPFLLYNTLKLVDLGGQPVTEGFEMTTVEGTKYRFRLADGSIISPEQK
jgi:hypothetical protein